MLFVSHATPEDNEFSRWLALQLAKEGFPVWCDLTKLLGGEPFWKEIEVAIRLRTRRFLFVLSKNSNQKEGTLDELSVASTIRKQLKDDHFIIPLRIDDLPFGDININLHKLNAIDFSHGWMTGFRKLVERLNDDGIAKDVSFGTDAVAVWWRQNFGENEGVSETTDYYCSNRLPLLSLPAAINVIRLKNAFPDNFDLALAPHPISPHKQFLLSFATTRDLLPLIEGHRLGLDSYSSRETAQFVEEGEGKLIGAKSARNHVRFLVRQGFERLALARGMMGYNLSGRRRFFWFPSDLVPDNKVRFPAFDGSNAWRGIVGYKSIKAKDGKARIRNWHFGIEGVPRIGFESYVSLLPHVVFSEDGVVYASTKKQHSCRRSQCKSWYNDDWRDRIIATLHYLADGKSQLQVPLGSEAFYIIEARLQMIESPVTYVKTLLSKTSFAKEAEDLIGEENEEELEDDDDE
jgi:hypothetical protein